MKKMKKMKEMGKKNSRKKFNYFFRLLYWGTYCIICLV